MPSLTQIHDTDLKLLRCFCTIVEEGSFTAAQATLNLSQSMLSEYMKSLELRLGTRLCQRGPKGFKLFPEGEIVYEAAKELFASVETFKQRASELHDGAGHELVIGIQDHVVDNPKARIAEAIARFSEYYPNIRFRLEIMLGFQMTGRVADGLVHVGIGLVNDQFSQLTFEHLFDEEAHFYCSRTHPLFHLDDDEITQEHIESAAYANRGHLEYIHPERTRNASTRGDIGHGAHAHMTLILSGRNIGYMPDHVAESYVKSGILRPLRPDLTHLATRVGAVYGPSSADFKLARRFVDCLVDSHMETDDTALTSVPARPGGTGRAGIAGRAVAPDARPSASATRYNDRRRTTAPSHQPKVREHGQV
ncbi:HTH-type transcriptional regulator GltR [Hartmannibacter diazotrophicus]|uniref:HTH-type transcriptional regulator GltR n=1 Tax=Hartmannibacter diazotrophicus TaxID=1482074 RepID=A0A2C9D5Q2_9HYPH|nr:LysR family transcriptional regulator [Hartmannibacter diazotrophicus]SON55662.1 HTH-type transcriptional regulator GltR [Hartmannibacter diazotrophicus]